MSADRTLLATGGGLAGVGGIWAAVHTAAPNGVELSAGALSITAILLVALVAVIVALFGLLLTAKEVQIAEWKRLAERCTETSRAAVQLATKEGP